MTEHGIKALQIQYQNSYIVHRKKRLAIYASPAGMSLTKLSLAGNESFPASLVSAIAAGDGKSLTFVYSVAPLQRMQS